MEAHAEHEEDHPDLGQLGRDRGVRDESRREGADRDAGEPDDLSLLLLTGGPRSGSKVPGSCSWDPTPILR